LERPELNEWVTWREWSKYSEAVKRFIHLLITLLVTHSISRIIISKSSLHNRGFLQGSNSSNYLL
jgi:hypothetical protein